MLADSVLQVWVKANQKETAAFAGHAESKARRVCEMLIQRPAQEYIIQSMEISMFLFSLRLSVCYRSLFPTMVVASPPPPCLGGWERQPPRHEPHIYIFETFLSHGSQSSPHSFSIIPA